MEWEARRPVVVVQWIEAELEELARGPDSTTQQYPPSDRFALPDMALDNDTVLVVHKVTLQENHSPADFSEQLHQFSDMSSAIWPHVDLEVAPDRTILVVSNTMHGVISPESQRLVVPDQWLSLIRNEQASQIEARRSRRTTLNLGYFQSFHSEIFLQQRPFFRRSSSSVEVTNWHYPQHPPGDTQP